MLALALSLTWRSPTLWRRIRNGTEGPLRRIEVARVLFQVHAPCAIPGTTYSRGAYNNFFSETITVLGTTKLTLIHSTF